MSGALLLAAAAGLVGSWAYAPAPHRAGALPTITACETDDLIRYAADGSYATVDDERGRWSLRGDRLTERVTHRDGVRVRERPGTSRLRWFSRDHVNIEHRGRRLGLLRCPA